MTILFNFDTIGLGTVVWKDQLGTATSKIYNPKETYIGRSLPHDNANG